MRTAAILSIVLATAASASGDPNVWGVKYERTPAVSLGDFIEPELARVVDLCPVTANISEMEKKTATELRGRHLSKLPREVYNARQGNDVVLPLKVWDVETAKLFRAMQRLFTTSDRIQILEQIRATGGYQVLDERQSVPQYEPANSITYNTDCALLAASLNSASASFGVEADAVIRAQRAASSAAGFAVGYIRNPIVDIAAESDTSPRKRRFLEQLWQLYLTVGDKPLYFVPRVRAASLVTRTLVSHSVDAKANLSVSAGIGLFSFASENKVELADSSSYSSNSNWSYVFLQPSSARSQSNQTVLVPQFDALGKVYSRASVAARLSKQMVMRVNAATGRFPNVQLELDRYDQPTIAVTFRYADNTPIPKSLCQSSGWQLSLTGADRAQFPTVESTHTDYDDKDNDCIATLRLSKPTRSAEYYESNATFDQRLSLRLTATSAHAKELALATELEVVVRDAFAVNAEPATCTGSPALDCTANVDLYLRSPQHGDGIDYASATFEAPTVTATDGQGAQMQSLSVRDAKITFAGSRGTVTFKVVGSGWATASVAYVLKFARGKLKTIVHVAGKPVTLPAPK
jgi:hypothetical protein